MPDNYPPKELVRLADQAIEAADRYRVALGACSRICCSRISDVDVRPTGGKTADWEGACT